ncbi:MAG: cytochrome c [Verrucomicrobiota bacterium]
MRFFFAAFIILILSVVIFFGFRRDTYEIFGLATESKPGRFFLEPPIEIFPDMDHQPKYKAQTSTDFFADGRSNRKPIQGTLSFDQPIGDEYLLTGQMKGDWGNGLPVEVTAELLERGKERYVINCQVCHGATGIGNGIVSQYGLGGIASLVDERIQQQPDGQIYYTIVKGKGQMGPYSHIEVKDRWAIVAYIRALQIKEGATAASMMPPQPDLEEESMEEEASSTLEEADAVDDIAKVKTASKQSTTESLSQ